MIAVQPIFTQIQEELWSLFATEQHSTTDILRYISSAIRYIANDKDYDFLKKRITVVVTEPDVEVITPVKFRTHYVYLWSVRKTPLVLSEWYHPNISSDFVMSFEDKFIAKEVGTYTVIASVMPTLPTAQTDTIDLPEYVADILVAIALHYWYKKSSIWDKANEQLNIAQAILAQFANRTENRTPQDPVSMPRNNPL